MCFTELKHLQNNNLHKISIISSLTVICITNEMQFHLFP